MSKTTQAPKSRPANGTPKAQASVKHADTDSAPVQGVVQVEHLRVRSLHPAFRRCGRSFGQQSVDIPLDELSDIELDALESEPALATQRVTLDVPGAPADGQDDSNGSGEL